jgi:type IV secretory pathway VirB10-like protein
MPEPNQNAPATVPEQPEAKPPMRKSMPIVIALVVIIGLIGIANLSSLLSGSKKNAPNSAMPMRPAAPNAQQVNSFESQQQLQAQRDAEAQQHQQELNAALQQLQKTEGAPNAPKHTSEMSQAQAEAKQKQLAKEKQQQDAINSDTVAIDFERTAPAAGTTEAAQGAAAIAAGGAAPAKPASVVAKADSKSSAMAGYDFDTYDGRLYRIFEGTVLEGVVTNHIDGGFSGPIMVSLTTDLYSHDHQQLLLPQGTRLLGEVQSVGNAQQRKMFVTFHRAICPDGFSLEFAKYIGLDQIGTTGLATKVDHGYLQAFAAAAAIGGLGGLAQIGNSGTVLDPSTQIRNGISEQSATEGEQVLNHFLNRLPIITLKEGSRARVYIGTDLLIPAFAEHRVDPTL